MKRFADDTADIQYRAMRAARETTASERMAALTEVFQDCGTAATVYADPTRVTQLLVSAAVKAFMDERKETVYRHAG